MFSTKSNEPVKINSNSNYYKANVDYEFPIKNYIVEKHGYAPCFYTCENSFDYEILEYLLKQGNMMNFLVYSELEDALSKKIRSGFFWFSYKDIYVKLSAKLSPSEYDSFDDELVFTKKIKTECSKKNKTFTLTICAPADVKDYHLKDFTKFLTVDTDDPKVHLFIKNQYGDYVFEPISVNLPKNLDLETNYGKKFLSVDSKIKERLEEKPNGLYMFHGPPGTGKTTYIKYLASCVSRDFIYIPTTMIEHFTSDPNCLHTLIQKPNSVIILEDAEKAILKRMGDGMDSSAVSSLLNLSDGILSDIVKTSVIVTYNCPKQDVDDALKRKGRLQVEYEFGALSVEESKNLGKKLNYPQELIDEKITKSLTLNEIYNLEKEVEFYGQTKKPEPKRIGF